MLPYLLCVVVVIISYIFFSQSTVKLFFRWQVFIIKSRTLAFRLELELFFRKSSRGLGVVWAPIAIRGLASAHGWVGDPKANGQSTTSAGRVGNDDVENSLCVTCWPYACHGTLPHLASLPHPSLNLYRWVICRLRPTLNLYRWVIRRLRGSIPTAPHLMPPAFRRLRGSFRGLRGRTSPTFRGLRGSFRGLRGGLSPAFRGLRGRIPPAFRGCFRGLRGRTSPVFRRLRGRFSWAPWHVGMGWVG